MRDLELCLNNTFDDERISLKRLVSFGTDHFQRLMANQPGGLLGARIAVTAAALAAVEAAGTGDEVRLGLRKARKKAKKTFRAALPGQMAKLAAAVVARYGTDSAVVTECFPFGRTVFAKSTDDCLKGHLESMINGLTAHEADLGADVVAEAGGLLSTWEAVWQASEESSGAKTSTQKDLQAARANLQQELFVNLLLIGVQFPRQPEKLRLYMQQSLLKKHSATKEPAAT